MADCTNVTVIENTYIIEDCDGVTQVVVIAESDIELIEVVQQGIPGIAGGVTKFNNRVGFVVPQTGDYTTDMVPQGTTNKYFTNALAVLAVSGVLVGPLFYDGTHIGIQQASASQPGYLSSTDWTTFNNKQSAITAGNTSQYWRGDKTFQTLNTAAVAESGNLYWTQGRFNTAVAAISGAANGLAPLGSDSKIPSAYLPPLAITDTFVVSSQAAMLALTAQTGDIAVRTDISETFILQGSDPTILSNWVELATPPGGVTSVNGQTGNVTLTTTNVAEGTNQYFTNARARGAVSATSPLAYNSTTGVFSIQAANTSQAGYLSSTDWNTFNNKQAALGFTAVPNTRKLTINGIQFDLSVDRSWTISAATPGGSSGSLQFNDSGVLDGFGLYNPTGSIYGNAQLDLFNDGQIIFSQGSSGAGNLVMGDSVQLDGDLGDGSFNNSVNVGGASQFLINQGYAQGDSVGGGINATSGAAFFTGNLNVGLNAVSGDGATILLNAPKTTGLSTVSMTMQAADTSDGQLSHYFLNNAGDAAMGFHVNFVGDQPTAFVIADATGVDRFTMSSTGDVTFSDNQVMFVDGGLTGFLINNTFAPGDAPAGVNTSNGNAAFNYVAVQNMAVEDANLSIGDNVVISQDFGNWDIQPDGSMHLLGNIGSDFLYKLDSTGSQLVSVFDGTNKVQVLKGGQSAPILPSAISGLAAWWKADAITGLTNGSPVASWVDSSGNSRPMTQSSAGLRPTYVTNVQNGLPGVLFTSTAGSGLISGYDPGVTNSVFLVYIQTNNGGGGFPGFLQRAIQSQSANGPILGPYQDVQTYYNGAGFIQGAAVTLNTPYLQEVIQQGASVINTFYVNGTTIGNNSSTGGGVSYGGGMAFSSGGAFNEPFQGYILETIVYNRALSQLERNQIEQYIANKYAMTVSTAVLQSADYLELQDYLGNILSKFDAYGNLTLPTGGLTVGPTTYDLVFNSGFAGIGVAIPYAPWVLAKTQTLDVMPTSLVIQSTADARKRLMFGYNDTLQAGEIGTVYSGAFWQSTIMQRQGGGVAIGLNGLPLSKLDVNGGVAIGAYAGTQAAPTNGLIVSGKTGLGNISSPTAILNLGGGTATAGTASLKLGQSTVLTTPEDGAMEYAPGSLFFSKGTTRYLIPLAFSGRVTAQTAAATIATLTVGATDQSFEVSANILITAATVNNFTCTCTYTDEGNTLRALTLNFSQLTGAFITAMTNVTGAAPYEGVPVQIRCKASSTITLATVGTFTTVTYNAQGNIKQIG